MKYIVIVASVYFLVFTSCRKHQEVDPSKSEITFDLYEFPLNLNSQWTYLRKDFYTNTTDTLTLKITDIIYNENDSLVYKCRLSIRNEYVDSAVFEVYHNRLVYHSISPTGYSFFSNFVLNFPFNENSYWIGNHIPDTVRVNTILDTLNVLGNKYNEVFYVKRAYSLIGGYSIVQSLQICRKFGIIKQNVDYFNSGNVQKQSFDLIQYSPG